jgi:hypothetical protein
MRVFAANPDDVRPAFLMAWLAGSGAAILVSSLVQMFLLLGACKLARVPGVTLSRAWTTVVICDLVFYGFLVLIVLGQLIAIQEDSSRSSIRTTYQFLLSPVNFIYAFVGAALGHAAVFSSRLAERDEPVIGFGRATAAAVVYLGFNALVVTFAVLITWITRAGPIR